MKAIYILSILCFMIAACSPAAEPFTATAVVAQAQSPTAPPTNTLTYTPPSIQTATPTSTPISTLTPTNTPTRTLTPSPLPLVTEPSLIEVSPSATPSTSEAQPTAPLSDPDSSPRPQRVNVLAHARSGMRDVTYCTVGNAELKLDIYYPMSRTGVTQLVIFIHGGGLSKGDKRGGEGMLDAPSLLDAGFTVASLNYRLAPEYKFPTMIQDVKCAVRFLRAHANEYKIDANKIGVWGTSAGGLLVNLLGTTDSRAGFDVGEYLDQSSRVQAVVDMFGPGDLTVDFSSAFIELKEQAMDGFDLVQASPVTHVTPDDPPFLILQGDVEQVVPLSQSQSFYNKLASAGIDAELVVVRGGPHGLAAPNQSPSRDELTKRIVKFFEDHLK